MSKSVLVTGGANGIGWACAQEFAQAGWRVMIGDLDAAGADARAREFPDHISAIDLDVRDSSSVERAFQETITLFGKLDALVNNAGIQKWTSLADLDWSTWSTVMDVNLNGTLRCLHAAGRHMLANGGGSIVNVASISAERGVNYRAPYSVSKAAIIALTRAAAVEWADRSVRVNAIGPGYVSTDLIESYVADGRLDSAALCSRIPMQRMAQPKEIARAIRFLASDDASYVTGQTLFVDGGFLANSGLPGNFTGNETPKP